MSITGRSGAQRYGDPQTATRYPLACGQDLEWQVDNDSAQAVMNIQAIDAGSIVVPSVCVVGEQPQAAEVTLIDGDSRWELPPVPNHAAAMPDPGPEQVSMHLDCFHTHRALSNVQLHFRLRGVGRPSRYLLTASWRPLELENPTPPEESICATPPPALSQMSQGGPQGPHTCSPTCVAMVLRGLGAQADLEDTRQRCYDPGSKMYGMWPYAILTAAHHGHVGATEVFVDWSDPLRVLEADTPMVASIRFARDTLPGAPLNASGGHLVVVHGASPECVVVNDPAAPEVATVPRTYDTIAFTQAWLRHRGAAYILSR